MTRFIIRRIIQSIPTFFGITILSYAIMLAAPGDPVSLMTFDPGMSEETREAMRDRLGVDDPLPLQYLRWLIGDDWRVVTKDTWYKLELEDSTEAWLSDQMMTVNGETGEIELSASRQPYRAEAGEDAEVAGRVGRRDMMTLIEEIEVPIYGRSSGILRLDFGQSFQYKRPPLDLIFERLPASIELNVAVILVGLILGVVVGVLSAVWHGQTFDQAARVLAVVGDAIPTFWLSFLVILAFAAPGLGLLPMGDRCDVTLRVCPPVWQRLEYLILPTFVLSLGGIAGWSRYIRASMLENINSDYVRTAKSKGLHPNTVWYKHALRNALIPMATFLGPVFVGVLGGSVVIEQIFAWPGVGRLLLDAVSAQDYPIVMANVVLGAVLTIISYMISDILYAVFDPRIRL